MLNVRESGTCSYAASEQVIGQVPFVNGQQIRTLSATLLIISEVIAVCVSCRIFIILNIFLPSTPANSNMP
jgi:hypothetical protein